MFRIRKPINKNFSIILGIVSIVFLCMSYLYLAHERKQENPNDTTIPNFIQFKEGVGKIFTPDRNEEVWIWEDSKATLTRLVVGMGLGILLSVVLGTMMGCWAFVESLLYPPLSILAKVPATAAMAVFFVLVGSEMPMFASIVAFTVTPTLAIAVFLSIKDIPEQTINKSYTLDASIWEMISNVIVPMVVPKILENIRLVIGAAIIVLIAAEMLISDVGFGYRIRIEGRKLNMNIVYVYLMFLALYGYAFDYFLKFTQSKLCPWSGERHDH